MAHQAHGAATVRNRPSGGALFEIRLPLERQAGPGDDIAAV